MPTLTIKDVPKDLHRRLSERARRHGRSPDEEALTCLMEALPAPPRRSAKEVIAEAEELNRKVGVVFPDIVNEAKREGRA